MHALVSVAFMLFFCLLPSSEAAELSCPTAASNRDIAELLDSADAALDDADVDGFRTTIEQVAMNVPCLSESIDPELAARLHTLQGIRHYVAGNPDEAMSSFLAARVLNPDTSLPAGLFPEGHEIHGVFNKVDVGEVQSFRLPAPKEGDLLIDGVVARAKPLDRPFVAQRVTGDTVVDTRYLGVGEAVINYKAVPLTRVASSGPRGQRIRLSLLSAVATGGVFGWQYLDFKDFEGLKPHTLTEDEKNRRVTTNRILLGTSSALALTSVGLVWTSFGLADE
jgi:hypothetical protein